MISIDFSSSGWIIAIFFLILSMCLLVNKIRLQKNITKLKKEHQDYIYKQMIDLRKICHNINTPVNTILTILEVFKEKIYGEISSEYLLSLDEAKFAVNDLRNNLQDIRNYCDYYVNYNKVSLDNLTKKENAHFKNPYVIEL